MDDNAPMIIRGQAKLVGDAPMTLQEYKAEMARLNNLMQGT